MLKEVGASGQLSLGKKFAGKLYDVIAHPDGRFELIPVRVVAAAQPEAPKSVESPDGWVPPGGYESATQWTLDNRQALDAYARQIEREGTAAEQLLRYLADHPEVEGPDAEV
jgi:hypothetical protein